MDSLITTYSPTGFFPTLRLLTNGTIHPAVQARGLGITPEAFLCIVLYIQLSANTDTSSSQMHLKSMCIPWSLLLLALVQFPIMSCLDQCNFPHCISLPLLAFYNSFFPQQPDQLFKHRSPSLTSSPINVPTTFHCTWIKSTAFTWLELFPLPAKLFLPNFHSLDTGNWHFLKEDVPFYLHGFLGIRAIFLLWYPLQQLLIVSPFFDAKLLRAGVMIVLFIYTLSSVFFCFWNM